jgi:hypothetical protein
MLMDNSESVLMSVNSWSWSESQRCACAVPRPTAWTKWRVISCAPALGSCRCRPTPDHQTNVSAVHYKQCRELWCLMEERRVTSGVRNQ